MPKVLINSKTVQYKYVNLIEQTPKTNFWWSGSLLVLGDVVRMAAIALLPKEIC